MVKWHTENYPGDWGLRGAVFIRDEAGNNICYVEYITPYCVGASSKDMAEVKAAKETAELIASAPALRETLEYIYRHAEERLTEFELDLIDKVLGDL